MRENLTAADFVVGLTDFMPQEADAYDVILPLSHAMESWDELESRNGVASYVQPLLEPLHNSRAEGDILIRLMQSGSQTHSQPADYKAYLDARWAKASGIKELKNAGFVEKQPPTSPLRLQIRRTLSFLNDVQLPTVKESFSLIFYIKI